jgi:GT2 family glycosyltransferase
VRIAILVLSVDEAERLETCLPAAARQGADAIVVIDNACVDASAEIAREYGEVVGLPERCSYAAAMNAGLRATRDYDAVLLLNADCVLEPGALEALRRHLADPAVGAVAPKLVRATDPTRIDAAGMLLDRRRKNNVAGHNAPATAYTVAGPVFGPDGACGLWRRATLDDCAPDGEVFDEDLALWASDADLAWRAQLLGWQARYEPAAIGHHVRFFSPSTRGAVPAEHRRLQFRNRLLMIAKNDRPRDVLRDLPHVLAYELLALAYALLVERELLGGYRDAWRLRAGARRRRGPLQSRRRAVPSYGLVPDPGSERE